VKNERRRIDQLLVESELVESRQKAQALILAGQVLIKEQKIEKPGQPVDRDSKIRILARLPFVSRAGAKLQAALDYFRVDVADRICADLGASTGGFTDCLLQRGARGIHTYDVGKDLLDWKLRTDRRVVVHDEFNVRDIVADDLPDSISLVTIDLSFISLTKILIPLYCALASKHAEIIDVITLVKPQFEVGKGAVGKGGIVRDPLQQLAMVESVREFAINAGYNAVGQIPSPIQGAKGNQEFLLYLQLLPELSSKA
jgi:23S rRNA (cytidine1920-2'-O)/16S rRNA (cytidine1409-2'-O)-methyltransferase